MPRASASAKPLGPYSIALVGAAAILSALLFGIVGGYFGFKAQGFLLAALVPAALIVVSPRAGLLVYILLVPFNGSTLLPREIQNIVYFGITALFFARLSLRFLGGNKINLPLPKELWMYIAVMLLATAIGYTHLDEITPYFMFVTKIDKFGFKEYVVGFFVKQMTLVIMAALIVWIVVNKFSDGRWIMNLSIGSGVLFVLCMLGYFALLGFPVARLQGDRALFAPLGRQSNSAGGMLMFAMASSLYMWERVRGGWSKWLLFATTLMLIVGIVMTVSRGAILGMLVVLTLYVIEFRRVRSAFIVVLVVVSLFALAPEAIQSRLFQGLDSRSITMSMQGPGDEVTSGRLDIWRNLAPEILKNPIFGSGLLSTQWSSYARSGGYWASHPHSFYMSVLMDVGLVGAIVIFLLYRYVWRNCRALARDDRFSLMEQGFFQGAAASLLAYLVFGLANGFAYPMPDQTFFWVAIGLVIGYRYRWGPAPVKAPISRRPAYRPRYFGPRAPGR